HLCRVIQGEASHHMKHPIDAEPHRKTCRPWLEMDVARTMIDTLANQAVHGRHHAGVACGERFAHMLIDGRKRQHAWFWGPRLIGTPQDAQHDYNRSNIAWTNTTFIWKISKVPPNVSTPTAITLAASA